MKKRYIASLLLLSGLFVGCMEQDKSEVSKENFTKVLNDHYKQDKNCILLDEYYPTFIYINSRSDSSRDKINMQKSYEKLGFVSMKLKDKNTSSGNFQGYEINLTDEGKKEFIHIKGFSGVEGFCAGYYGVDEITNYTKPADMFGQTISRVKFTIKPKEIKPWAKELVDNELFKKKFAPQDEKAVLLLTEVKGWVHEKDFKNK